MGNYKLLIVILLAAGIFLRTLVWAINQASYPCTHSPGVCL